jgi:hypothetical protein
MIDGTGCAGAFAGFAAFGILLIRLLGTSTLTDIFSVGKPRAGQPGLHRLGRDLSGAPAGRGGELRLSARGSGQSQPGNDRDVEGRGHQGDALHTRKKKVWRETLGHTLPVWISFKQDYGADLYEDLINMTT